MRINMKTYAVLYTFEDTCMGEEFTVRYTYLTKQASLGGAIIAVLRSRGWSDEDINNMLGNVDDGCIWSRRYDGPSVKAFEIPELEDGEVCEYES